MSLCPYLPVDLKSIQFQVSHRELLCYSQGKINRFHREFSRLIREEENVLQSRASTERLEIYQRVYDREVTDSAISNSVFIFGIDFILL